MIYAFAVPRSAPPGIPAGISAGGLVFIAFLLAVVGILTSSGFDNLYCINNYLQTKLQSFFLATIAPGGNRLAPVLAEIGAWRIVCAPGLYGLAFYLHGLVGPPLL